MIEKSTKKTSGASEKKAEPAKPSSASTLKTGLAAAKAAPAAAPAGPKSSASSAPRLAGSEPPAAKLDDQLKVSSELRDRKSRPGLPQLGVVDNLRDAFGDGSKEKSPRQSWTHKIGDILTGNSGRLGDLVGLAKPADPAKAQELPQAPTAEQPGSKEEVAGNLWERLWGVPAPTPKEEKLAAPTWGGAKDSQQLLGDYRSPSDAQIQHNWGEEVKPKDERSETVKRATQGLEDLTDPRFHQTDLARPAKENPAEIASQLGLNSKLADGARPGVGMPLAQEPGKTVEGKPQAQEPGKPVEGKPQAQEPGKPVEGKPQAQEPSKPVAEGKPQAQEPGNHVEGKPQGQDPGKPYEGKPQAQQPGKPVGPRGHELGKAVEGKPQAQEPGKPVGPQPQELGKPVERKPQAQEPGKPGAAKAIVENELSKPAEIEAASQAEKDKTDHKSGDKIKSSPDAKKLEDDKEAQRRQAEQLACVQGAQPMAQVGGSLGGGSLGAAATPVVGVVKAKDRLGLLDRARDSAGQAIGEAAKSIGGPLGKALGFFGKAVEGQANEKRHRQETVEDATRDLRGPEKTAVENALRDSKIDSELLKEITKDGFGISRVSDRDARLKDDKGRIREGFYNYTDNKIRLADSAFRNPDELKEVLFDEIGHRIDDKLRSTPETSRKWSDMMKTYAEKESQLGKINANAGSNQGEFGSEVISAYLRGGEAEKRLKDGYPELYNTIQETVGKSDRSDLESGGGFFSRFLNAGAAQVNQLQGKYFTASTVPPTEDAQSSKPVGEVAIVKSPGPTTVSPQPKPDLAPPRETVLGKPEGTSALHGFKSDDANRSTQSPRLSATTKPVHVTADPTPRPAETTESPRPPVSQPQQTTQPPQTYQPHNQSGGGQSSGNSGNYSNYNYFQPSQSDADLSSQISQLSQSGLNDLSLQSLASSQQELQMLDQSLWQSGGLTELQNLSQGLQGLDGLPQSLQRLDGLKELVPTLENVPKTLEGLGKVHDIFDKVKGLPTNPKELGKSSDLKQIMKDLPQVNSQLKGLGELARQGPQLPGQMQQLSQMRQVGDSLQQLGKQAQEWKQLPAKLDQLSQALPVVRAAQQEGSLPTRLDGSQPAPKAGELPRPEERAQSVLNPQGRAPVPGEPKGPLELRGRAPEPPMLKERQILTQPLGEGRPPAAVPSQMPGVGAGVAPGQSRPVSPPAVDSARSPGGQSEAVAKLDTKITQRLQTAPVLARQLERLPQAQENLKQVVSSLEKSTQQPHGLAALRRTTSDPGSMQVGLDTLKAVAQSPQDKANVEQLRKTLQPVLTDPSLRQGLKQADAALQPFAQGAGKQQILSFKKVHLDTPVTRQLSSDLKMPQARGPAEKVTQGLSQARELQRATEAQQNRLPQLAGELPADLGESLAKIIRDAQASNRPRSLFGIQLGGQRAGAGAVGGAVGGAGSALWPGPSPTTPAAVPVSRPAPVVAQQAGPAPASPGAKPAVQVSAPGGAPDQPRQVMSKARVEAYRQTYETVKDQLIGKGGKHHPWALVYHSRDAEGAKGLTDTLESNVVKGGSGKFQNWLSDITKTPDSTVALSAILANVANVAPDRMVGIMLLTTDGAGGKEAVGDAFHKMSQNVDSSLRLSHFLEQSSKHPNAARGVAELFDTLTEPQGENWSSATKAAETFRGLSETVGGSRRLTQTFDNLSEVEGGNRLIARTLNRMSRTEEGAQSALDTLGNLAHDKEGAADLGKVLSRASESRDGARDLLASLQTMSKKNGGKQDVARLFVSLAEGGQGARLLANFAKDGNNTGHLAQLFDQLSQNPESRQLLTHALGQMANHPRQRSNYEVFAGRVASSEALQAAVSHLTSTNKDAEDAEVALEVQRTRPLFLRLPELTELPDIQARPPADLNHVSETWRSERPGAPEAAAGLAEKPAEQNALESKGFRPGDVYSEETLRHARICGDCGGRTTSMGFCPRCSAQKQARQQTNAV
ncbi:hypothetical protein IV102_07320 [bacterium]|nr:hypothetical protein [bacterium]